MADPNNYFIEEDNIIFQMICKACNTSMKWLLIELFEKDNRKHSQIALNPSLKWKMLDTKEFSNNSLVIGFSRHPEDRLISCWKDKVNGVRYHKGFDRRHPNMFKHKMSFDEFIKSVSKIKDGPGLECDQHFRSQTFDLDLNRLNYIIRFEHIRHDWGNCQEIIENHCGRVYPDIPHRNSSGSFSKPQIDNKTRLLIEERYSNDYDLLNYERRSTL
jgi:hypothetical protein